MRWMRVATMQTGLGGHEPRVLSEALRRCGDEGIELLVLPECYFGGMPTEVTVSSLALAPPYQRMMEAFVESPASTTIVAGFTEASTAGGPHSAVAVLRGGEVLGLSRKLFPRESFFAAGTGLPTYALGAHAFGVLICNDANFVELGRMLALAGARVLVCCLNNDLPAHVTDRWVTRTRATLIARAVENDCWVVAADVAGVAGNRRGVGGACIIAPDGEVVIEAGGLPGFIAADISIPTSSMLTRWDIKSNQAMAQQWSELLRK
jgi:predicted amidohydrolase